MMRKIKWVVAAFAVSFALVATGCGDPTDQAPEGNTESTSGTESGTSSGTEAGSGSEEGGDSTQTGGQTGGNSGESESGEESGGSGEGGSTGGQTGGNTGGESETVAVTEVKIACDTKEVTVGQTITLTASVSPDNATNKTVTWSTGAADVATVDANGTVKGVKAGNATITAKAGDKTDSVEITVKAITYAVGDIILTDGTKVNVADVSSYSINESNKPVGVVAFLKDDGAPLVLGLRSLGGLAWATEDTTGYTTNFEAIAATCSGNSTEGYTFTGDTDGSDNWAEICKVDSSASENAQKNYPAFNYANTYGTNEKLTGDLAKGWYIPSIAELYKVFQNKVIIQENLTKAGGFDFRKNMYWSSTQADYFSIAYSINASDGKIYNSYSKHGEYDVLVLHQF